MLSEFVCPSLHSLHFLRPFIFPLYLRGLTPTPPPQLVMFLSLFEFLAFLLLVVHVPQTERPLCARVWERHAGPWRVVLRDTRVAPDASQPARPPVRLSDAGAVWSHLTDAGIARTLQACALSLPLLSPPLPLFPSLFLSRSYSLTLFSYLLFFSLAPLSLVLSLRLLPHVVFSQQGRRRLVLCWPAVAPFHSLSCVSSPSILKRCKV